MRAVVLVLIAACAGFGGEPPAFERIDAHAHVCPPPEAFFRMLGEVNARLLNVTLIDPLAPGFDKPEPQTSWAIEIASRSGGRVAWASALDLAGWEEAGYAERAAGHLEETFRKGAVAVKVYKSLGLVAKSAAGKYALPDHPAFAPVFEAIARSGKTLVAHIGDPRSSWRELDPGDPHYAYYSKNPKWHMFRHPERPSWEKIIAARDRMLAAHPALRVVGCHLGSMEHDVAEIAARLERYPNFAVDTAARVPDLIRQPREKVREFLIRYQDRVLWGTDLMEIQWENPAAAIERWKSAYQRDWEYFSTARENAAGGRRVQGLALPDAVLRKIFRENALRWIPGLSAVAAPVPAAAQVVSRYIEALGGRAALEKVSSRGARGTIESPTFGLRGSYEEIGAPGRYLRTIHFPNYGVIRRCADGNSGWTEEPEYGITRLSGARLEELLREGRFQPALELERSLDRLKVSGVSSFEGRAAVEVRAEWPGGAKETFWFDAGSGLLAGIESVETSRSGVRLPVRLTFEDYRAAGGVLVAHTVRYVNERVIWVVRRQVAHNIPVDPAVFRAPEK